MTTRLCGHSWMRLSGDEGRYRCEWCGVIGYRRKSLPGARQGRPAKINVYVCTAKGCQRGAIKVKRDAHNAIYQRCQLHDDEGDSS